MASNYSNGSGLNDAAIASLTQLVKDSNVDAGVAQQNKIKRKNWLIVALGLAAIAATIAILYVLNNKPGQKLNDTPPPVLPDRAGLVSSYTRVIPTTVNGTDTPIQYGQAYVTQTYTDCTTADYLATFTAFGETLTFAPLGSQLVICGTEVDPLIPPILTNTGAPDGIILKGPDSNYTLLQNVNGVGYMLGPADEHNNYITGFAYYRPESYSYTPTTMLPLPFGYVSLGDYFTTQTHDGPNFLNYQDIGMIPKYMTTQIPITDIQPILGANSLASIYASGDAPNYALYTTSSSTTPSPNCCIRMDTAGLLKLPATDNAFKLYRTIIAGRLLHFTATSQLAKAGATCLSIGSDTTINVDPLMILHANKPIPNFLITAFGSSSAGLTDLELLTTPFIADTFIYVPDAAGNPEWQYDPFFYTSTTPTLSVSSNPFMTLAASFTSSTTLSKPKRKLPTIKRSSATSPKMNKKGNVYL